MFVYVVLLEIRHHIIKSGLSRGLCPIFLDFIDFIHVFLIRWTQLCAEPFLGL